jgi:hypothetical protein
MINVWSWFQILNPDTMEVYIPNIKSSTYKFLVLYSEHWPIPFMYPTTINAWMIIPFYICLQPQNIWAPTLKMAIRSFTTQPNTVYQISYQVGQCWIYPQQCPHAWYMHINPNISICILLTSPKKGQNLWAGEVWRKRDTFYLSFSVQHLQWRALDRLKG